MNSSVTARPTVIATTATSSAAASDTLVKLNIGGRLFTTTKSTLLQRGANGGSSFFDPLLLGKLPSTRDETGAYFVDRNGDYFALILDFLRTGKLRVPDGVDFRAVVEEAQFYQIALPAELSGGLHDFFSFLVQWGPRITVLNRPLDPEIDKVVESLEMAPGNGRPPLAYFVNYVAERISWKVKLWTVRAGSSGEIVEVYLVRTGTASGGAQTSTTPGDREASVACAMLVEYARKGDLAGVNDTLSGPQSSLITPHCMAESLFRATDSNRAQVVRALVEHCGTESVAKWRKPDGGTLLFRACYQGHCEVARLLLLECGDDGRSCIDVSRTTDGSTPLYVACASGYTDVARLLVGQGADVNAVTRENVTPVLAAVLKRDLRIVQILTSAKSIRAAADAEAKSAESASTPTTATASAPLSSSSAAAAAESGATAVDARIARLADGVAPIHVAASNGDADIVDLLCRCTKVDLDAVTNSGESAMFAAVKANHSAVVDIMLEGACTAANPVKSYPVSGIMPLHAGVMRGSAGAVLSLVERHFIPPATRTLWDGVTPLHFAAVRGDVKMTRILVESTLRKNGTIDLKLPEGGQTPLFTACQFAQSRVVKVLLEEGKADVAQECEIDTCSSEMRGKTPLVTVLLDRYKCLCMKGHPLTTIEPTQWATRTDQKGVIWMCVGCGSDLQYSPTERVLMCGICKSFFLCPTCTERWLTEQTYRNQQLEQHKSLLDDEEVHATAVMLVKAGATIPSNWIEPVLSAVGETKMSELLHLHHLCGSVMFPVDVWTPFDCIVSTVDQLSLVLCEKLGISRGDSLRAKLRVYAQTQNVYVDLTDTHFGKKMILYLQIIGASAFDPQAGSDYERTVKHLTAAEQQIQHFSQLLSTREGELATSLTRSQEQLSTISKLQANCQELELKLGLQRGPFCEHILSHITQGHWVNSLTSDHQTMLVNFETPSKNFTSNICVKCPLEKVARMEIQREIGIDENEQLLLFNGQPSTDPFLTLEQLLNQLQDTTPKLGISNAITPLPGDPPTAATASSSTSTSQVETLAVSQREGKREKIIVTIAAKLRPVPLIEESALHHQKTFGMGQYGTVYKCTLSPQGIDVAVKRMHANIQSEYNDSLFTREASIVSSLRHPNVVRCLGLCYVDGTVSIISELLSCSLRELLPAKRLQLPEVMCLSLGISKGMEAIHKQGIMHRDLNSGNVLLDRNGIPKICDFGMSRLANHALAAGCTKNAGAPAYLPPQMFTAQYDGLKGDAWQFGILVSEMLAGDLFDPETPNKSALWPSFIEQQLDGTSPMSHKEVERLQSMEGFSDLTLVSTLARRRWCLSTLKAHVFEAPMFYQVIAMCLSISEEERPLFTAVVTLLSGCCQLSLGTSSTAACAVETTLLGLRDAIASLHKN
ncbi:mitogen-activated protein kinase kinase kinase [Pelomyxa schiedti]|nr:mitogen-activated protein kinase kinase kinase [Pelomyxa schiedti]